MEDGASPTFSLFPFKAKHTLMMIHIKIHVGYTIFIYRCKLCKLVRVWI